MPLWRVLVEHKSARGLDAAMKPVGGKAVLGTGSRARSTPCHSWARMTWFWQGRRSYRENKIGEVEETGSCAVAVGLWGLFFEVSEPRLVVNDKHRSGPFLGLSIVSRTGWWSGDMWLQR